jgi:glycosyltransferase involved in cell wall biosynthesis
LRLAYFSPLPPQRSGIADYSSELIPHLAQLVDLTLFVSELDQPDSHILNRYKVQSYKDFESRREDFDLILYNIGNSDFHDDISQLAIEFPGVVVLHDVFLHHSVAQRTIGKSKHFAYAREMGYEQGASGVRRAMAICQGVEPPLFEVPLNGRILDASLGVIVHSQFAASLVRKQGYKGPLAKIPAQIAPHAGQSRRLELNLPDNAVLYASFGLITKEKQIANILRALRRLRTEMPQAFYLLVGESMPDLPVSRIIRELDLEGAVHHIGYVPELADFIDWIHTSDIVINLRNPTVGETSATALRAMAAAKPLIVDDHGWYSEIPPEAAVMIRPGNESSLLDAMRLTGQSASLRNEMGDAGLRFTQDVCHPKVVANAYFQALMRIQSTVGTIG